ncbi:MAG: TPM domain-containing protein [Bacteroidetes bacterium]|nr:TPM domain-containing protein [Bacteroidota bacterium]
MSAKKFFTAEQQKSIQDAIANAELNTSGEIRVHIDDDCKEEVLDKAAKVFHKLKMNKTELRNGVLFYLAVNDRKFAILGDKGINEKVTADFWDSIKSLMFDHFKQQQFTEGLCSGIELAGEKLKIHFPLQSNDTNELDNEVSFGK